jgi:Na+:H+ antiporter, NhaA family
VVALAWASTPWNDACTSLRDAVVGPSALHLDLTVGAWTAEGLLALLFLVAGIELKREFVAGDLADRSKAALPIAAAREVAAPAVGALPALATVVLRLRNRHYKRVEIEETRDDDADGVPDVYERRDPAIGS